GSLLRKLLPIFDTDSRLRNADGTVNFDGIVAYNKGQTLAADTALLGTKGTDPNYLDGTYYTANSGRNGFIRRASMNSHNWSGILSTLIHKLNDNITLTTGIDGRYYRGIHYRRLENLLGNDAYLATSNINNPINYISSESPADFGNFGDNSYKTGNNVLNYWNDGLVSWIGAFAQVEYSTEKLSVFATLNGSNQGFKRIDYFVYEDSDAAQASDWQNFFGGVAKAGANYNINDQHNVFLNAGYTSRQPIFDNVFINFRNDINPDLSNQQITSFELGYGFRTQGFRANVNLYNTNWGNRQFDRTVQNVNNQDILYVFRDVTQVHRGLEIEGNYAPIRQLSLTLCCH
ncbi:MAG: TonB-dependent receptor, partial [Saprospiraceae bacterium]|nr:TonB-dependent receptor [Saprospiraceae bacterium]